MFPLDFGPRLTGFIRLISSQLLMLDEESWWTVCVYRAHFGGALSCWNMVKGNCSAPAHNDVLYSWVKRHIQVGCLGVHKHLAIYSQPYNKFDRGITGSKWNAVCFSISAAGPVMDCRPVQGVPRLSPNNNWDRHQPTCDHDGLSAIGNWWMNEWMNKYISSCWVAKILNHIFLF